MKFQLSMSARFVPCEKAEMYEALGFKFLTDQWAIDEHPFDRVLDRKVDPTIEFKDLDQLMSFVDELGECVIRRFGPKNFIEIYNEYRE